MFDGMTGHGWGMGWGWIIGIIIIALIIWMVIRSASQNRPSSKDEQSKSPLDILKERYVRGEIDEEEFESRKKGLM